MTLNIPWLPLSFLDVVAFDEYRIEGSPVGMVVWLLYMYMQSRLFHSLHVQS